MLVFTRWAIKNLDYIWLKIIFWIVAENSIWCVGAVFPGVRLDVSDEHADIVRENDGLSSSCQRNFSWLHRLLKFFEAILGKSSDNSWNFTFSTSKWEKYMRTDNDFPLKKNEKNYRDKKGAELGLVQGCRTWASATTLRRRRHRLRPLLINRPPARVFRFSLQNRGERRKAIDRWPTAAGTERSVVTGGFF